MRINNEKRREVAARLREVETLEYDGDEWCDEGDVLDALGVYNNDDPSSCDPDKVAFLADLIDRPTCEMEGYPGARYGGCSHCGAFIRRDAVMDYIGRVPVKYCSNCGAEVVE